MSAFAPLAHRPFRLLLSARLVSGLGSAVAPIAVAFAVLDLTGSSLDLGVVLAARTVPTLLLLLFGGIIADRLPRHRVLVVAGVVSVASQGLAATMLLTHTATVTTLALIEAVNGAAGAFTMPALEGLFAQVVPAELRRGANALFSLGGSGVRIGGAALGGIVVAAVGSGWAIAFDAATFGAAAVLFAALRIPAGDRISGGTMLADLREGWTEFASRQWLWVVVLGFGALNMVTAGAWNTLGPTIADGSFGRGWWGLLLAADTAGMLIGTAAMMRFDPARPMRAGIIGTITTAPLLALLGLVPNPPTLLVCSVLAGVGMGVFSVVWQTALQQHVPEDKLSRVFSYDMLGSFIAMPVGQLGAGFLATRFGAAEVVVGGGVVCLLATLGMLASPSVRGLGRGVPEPAVAAS
ncbi:MFS transporter [Solihabitans fulvus]|uniref:MFS transporter n=1 Tax=Solihabitans fulvus TaxID=1892852 RepID=A0A5B2WV95_9PSEU|nr:MFS transporter [Solihabitans fulvus]KAA2254824.1 MFS transporter [Solihabitans fulvus]